MLRPPATPLPYSGPDVGPRKPGGPAPAFSTSISLTGQLGSRVSGGHRHPVAGTGSQVSGCLTRAQRRSRSDEPQLPPDDALRACRARVSRTSRAAV
jgi:hypothetical protein